MPFPLTLLDFWRLSRRLDSEDCGSLPIEDIMNAGNTKRCNDVSYCNNDTVPLYHVQWYTTRVVPVYLFLPCLLSFCLLSLCLLFPRFENFLSHALPYADPGVWMHCFLSHRVFFCVPRFCLSFVPSRSVPDRETAILRDKDKNK